MPILIVEDAPALAYGIDKAGDQVIAEDVDDVQLTGWVRRDGFHYSGNVDALVVARGGSYTAECRITLTAPWVRKLYQYLYVAVLHNDTELVREEFADGEISHLISGTPVEMRPGDRIRIQITNTGPPATVVAGPESYMTIQPNQGMK